MTTDLQRRGLLSSILGHLPSASYEELRLLDLVIERLEFARTGHDRSWNFAVDLCDSLIRGLHGALHERDRQTAELQEDASAEMVDTPSHRRVIQWAQVGVITPERSREVLAALDRLEFAPDAHPTTVSDVLARIAARDIDEDEPYAEWDVEDRGGEGG